MANPRKQRWHAACIEFGPFGNLAERSAARCRTGDVMEHFEVKFVKLADGSQLGGSLIADAKTFKTGSVGYWAGGKVEFGGKRYQVSLSVVEIGSKPSNS